MQSNTTPIVNSNLNITDDTTILPQGKLLIFTFIDLFFLSIYLALFSFVLFFLSLV
jgi:hypothetical protein